MRMPATPDHSELTVISPHLQRAAVCPACRAGLDWAVTEVRCARCDFRYEVRDGIPTFLPREQGDDEHPHKVDQITFFDDEGDPEFETTRPHGAPAVYGWLMREKFRRSVSALGPLSRISTALTVCGGSGMDAEFLARCGLTVICSDISRGAAERSRARGKRYNVPIIPVVADVERLPFADRSVDLVYVHDGLHHLVDPLIGLREMVRVARVGVCITEPAKAAATSLAVKLGLALEIEEAGNRVARIEPKVLAEEVVRLGLQIRVLNRYPMYYKHEPGSVVRLTSRRRLQRLAPAASALSNILFGRLGTKLVVQAVRQSDTSELSMPPVSDRRYS
jgi:SAM-dependent methyltransferase